MCIISQEMVHTGLGGGVNGVRLSLEQGGREEVNLVNYQSARVIKDWGK